MKTGTLGIFKTNKLWDNRWWNRDWIILKNICQIFYVPFWDLDITYIKINGLKCKLQNNEGAFYILFWLSRIPEATKYITYVAD